MPSCPTFKASAMNTQRENAVSHETSTSAINGYVRRLHRIREYMKLKNIIRTALVTVQLTVISQIGQAQVVAIKAGKLVDPESATVVANQIILIEGQAIKSVGPDLKIPENATVIDLSKQTVLPGLFDAHTHLCMTTRRRRDGGNYYYTALLP